MTRFIKAKVETPDDIGWPATVGVKVALMTTKTLSVRMPCGILTGIFVKTVLETNLGVVVEAEKMKFAAVIPPGQNWPGGQKTPAELEVPAGQ